MGCGSISTITPHVEIGKLLTVHANDIEQSNEFDFILIEKEETLPNL